MRSSHGISSSTRNQMTLSVVAVVHQTTRMTKVNLSSTGAPRSQFLPAFYHPVSPRRIKSHGVNGFLIGLHSSRDVHYMFIDCNRPPSTSESGRQNPNTR